MDELLERQCGVISRRQALQWMSVGSVRRRVESGRWQVPHRGIYVTHTGPVDRCQRRWIAALAGGAGRPALLGGLSALETQGLRGFAAAAVHIVIPARQMVRNPPAGVVVHRAALIAPADVNPMGSPPGTVAARSMVDAAQWAPSDDQARAIIAAVFQQRLVRLDDVERVLAHARRARRRSVITAAVDDAAAGAHSLPESEFLRLCQRNQLPGPDLQHQRRDDTGRSRFLDAYFAEWGVHVEIDGAQHTDVRQWWADMYRQNSIWIAGDRILRFPAWAVRHQPEEVTAQLRDALSAAGWQPANAPASRQPAARAGKSS